MWTPHTSMERNARRRLERVEHARRARFGSLCLLLALFTVSTALGTGTTYYVWSLADGSGDGSSWEDAYNELKPALHVATTGDVIRVANGVYRTDVNPVTGNYTENRSLRIDLKPGVEIYGGYPVRLEGSVVIVGSRNPDPLTNNTYLDGFFGSDTNNIQHFASRVVSGGNLHGTVLDGFTIRRGRGDDSSSGGGANLSGNQLVLRNLRFHDNHVSVDLPPFPSGSGGGLRLNSGDVLLENVLFDENRGKRGGGLAIHGSSIKVLLRDCRFENNFAREGGGLGVMLGAIVQLEDCVFESNLAQGDVFTTTMGGGAIAHGSTSKLEVYNCLFVDNEAFLRGGGAIANDANLAHTVIRDSVFKDNEAGFSGSGGAVRSLGPLSVSGSEFTRNRAAYDGGALVTFHADTFIYNTRFYGNRSDRDGGGVCMPSTNFSEPDQGPIVVNSVFVGNRANTNESAVGGGLQIGRGISTPHRISVINCTFIANEAYEGGGLHVSSTSFTSIHYVANSIFYGNTANSGTVEEQQITILTGTGGPDVEIDHTIIQGLDTFTGNQNLASNPLFITSPSPGVDGVWGTTNDHYGNLQLSASSPGLDSGRNDALPPDVLDLNNNQDDTEQLPVDILDNPRRSQSLGVTPTGTGTPPIVNRGAYETAPIFVDASAAGNEDGSSWQDAFVAIDDAVTAAGHRPIHMAAGVYRATSFMGAPASLSITAPTAIWGGFPPGGGMLHERDPFTHLTIFEGEHVQGGITSRVDHVIHVNASGELQLDGAVVQHGEASMGVAMFGGNGGGILAQGPVTLTDVWVRHCTAEADGGGLFLDGEATLLRVHVSDCSADGWGGGLAFQGMALIVQESSFTDNAATHGGGVSVWASFEGAPAAKFYNTTFSGNTASSHGGAIANDFGGAVLSHCTLHDNVADVSGGGVYVSGSGLPISLLSTIVAGNQAPDDADLASDGSVEVISEDHNLIGYASVSVFQPLTNDQVGTSADLLDAALLPLTGDPATFFTQWHPLAYNSPAIEAGSASPHPVDQRGMPRLIHQEVDIGAYEWAGPVFLVHPADENIVLGDSVTLAYDVLAADHSEWYVGHPAMPDEIPTGTWSAVGANINPLEWLPIEPTQTFWVLATNAHGFAVSEGAEVTVTGTAREFWRWQTFGVEVMTNAALEATVWGWDATPGGPQVPNRFAWLLGRDPTAGPMPLFDNIFVEEVNGDPYVKVDFRRRFNHPGLLLQYSTDLDDWYPVVVNGQEVTLTVLDPAPQGDDSIEDIRLGFHAETWPILFFRVAEDSNPPQTFPLSADNPLAVPVGTDLPIDSATDVHGRTYTFDPPATVMRHLSITGGRANLDVDGSGAPATPAQYSFYGITDEEREYLAQRIPVGDSFIRYIAVNPWYP